MKKLPLLLLSVLILIPSFALSPADLQEAMLVNNPDIQKAKAEVSKAQLDVKDAKAGYSPTVDLTITGSYIANPIGPININLGDYISTPISGLPDYIQIYKGQESSYYQFQLSITQPIFTWGKISKSIKLYSAVSDARALQLEDTIEKTQTELNTRIAALYYLLQIQKVLEDQTQIAQRLITIADQAQANGMMLEADALAVKVQASQLDVAKAQIDQQVTIMLTAIEGITGLTDIQAQDLEFDEVTFQKDLETLRDMDYQNLVAKCLSDSRTTFQLLSKLSTIAQYTKDIANASVNWKPDFALVVNADYSGSRFPLIQTDWYRQDDWSATVTVALKSTIFDGGKAIRNVKRTQTEVESAEVDTQSAKTQIRSAVDQNWTNLFVYQAQIDYQNALAAQQDQKNQVNINLLDTGYGSESDYLQGQLERNNCQIEILQNKINQAAALYTLLYLQGENPTTTSDTTASDSTPATESTPAPDDAPESL